MNKNIVIIVASGFGTRMGSKIPKQFLCLKNKPIICHTIEKFESCNLIDEIIVVVSAEFENYFKTKILTNYNYKKISKIVIGGNQRAKSVYNGINAINDDGLKKIILIHDAVRPFIKQNLIEKLILETYKYKACILAVKAKDTIKICNNDFICNTPNRENIWLAQTPQAFEYSLLKTSYEKLLNSFEFTDDSSIIEKTVNKVKIIEGDYENIKITTKEDLKIAELFI